MVQTSVTKEGTDKAADAGVLGGTTGKSKTSGFSRRHFVAAAAATVAAGPLNLFAFNRRLNVMTEGIPPVAQEAGSDKTDVRPFHVNFSDAELIDLRKRIKATKWPERESVSDATQGVQLATMQALASYWGTSEGGSAPQRSAYVHHQDRRARHPFHPRSLKARKRITDDRHARMARARSSSS